MTIAETLIDLAAILAGVGGIACFVYLVSLVLWERHERRAFLDDYRREREARRAGYVPDLEPAGSRTVRTPSSYANRPRSLQHHA
jgi:hypothetical protein